MSTLPAPVVSLNSPTPSTPAEYWNEFTAGLDAIAAERYAADEVPQIASQGLDALDYAAWCEECDRKHEAELAAKRRAYWYHGGHPDDKGMVFISESIESPWIKVGTAAEWMEARRIALDAIKSRGWRPICG